MSMTIGSVNANFILLLLGFTRMSAMECILIFDDLNDIIFTKFNKNFELHINAFAKAQGLLDEPTIASTSTNNIIIQIFAPIVTSHRIMNCQFGNAYDSIKCDENLTIYFQEYMGYLFVVIGNNKNGFTKKMVNILIVLVRYLCGPDVYQLKVNDKKSKLAQQLINNWIYKQNNDQVVLVEAIEQLGINSDISGTIIKIVGNSVNHLGSKIESSKIHALILLENKLLCLYSSENAKVLSSNDIFFLSILCHEDPVDELDKNGISSYQILLSGSESQPKCLPHVVHVIPFFKGAKLIYIIEVGNPAVSTSIYETFWHMHVMQQVQIQRDKETLQVAFENLDIAIKRLNDSLKKNKNVSIENSYKLLIKKWDVIKKKYQKYFKNSSDESLLRAETLSLGFLEHLKQLFSLINVNENILMCSEHHAKEIGTTVRNKLETFNHVFQTKSTQPLSVGSDFLTVTKYLEEFPGLVTFLYIDRNTHHVTTPGIDCNSEEDVFLKKKVRLMINYSRQYLQAGTMSLLWKDKIFSYAYFLWFEDHNGTILKPVVFPLINVSLPGILCGDFYDKLKETCFPKMSANKIKCYELFCIHLGLVTASAVLEQARRLSATVWEVKGLFSHAIDFL